MLQLDIIEPYLGNWSSSVVAVPKPGPGDELRFCVDLRDVNEITETVKYPLPNIEDVVHGLGGKAKYFSKLDAAKGLWQVLIREDCKKYFAFSTRKGTWTFKRMPFGHKNAPGIF